MRRTGDKADHAELRLDASELRAGMRVGVGVSGGADSVALLRALAGQTRELGMVVHAAHLHHGLRGTDADGDRDFARTLASELGVAWHEARVDAAAEARENQETLEEAARRLRYAWFRKLMAEVPLDAIATAHTLDDQAETVLAKLLRGAWTEGLSGIHPVVAWPEGRIVRPMLGTARSEVEAYLKAIGQAWREDQSNRQTTFTRNRIRHELLPVLEGWNPQIKVHLAQMAELAREEEAWSRAETERLAGQMLLPGRPVRGGGRSGVEALRRSQDARTPPGTELIVAPRSSRRLQGIAPGGSSPGTAWAVDAQRLAELPVAAQRRLLRLAAQRLTPGRPGPGLDFAATEAVRALALAGHAGQKRELAGGLRAERTHRELRLTLAVAGGEREIPMYTVEIPGEIEAAEWGVRLRIERDGAETGGSATLRAWRPGDRVRLRHSGSPRKVKEVLERLHVTGSDRTRWPVVEIEGQIVWMRGADVESGSGYRVREILA